MVYNLRGGNGEADGGIHSSKLDREVVVIEEEAGENEIAGG